MAPYYSDHNSRLLQHNNYTSRQLDFDDSHDHHHHLHYNHHDHNSSSDDPTAATDGLLYLEDLDPSSFLLDSEVFGSGPDFISSSMTTPPSPMQHYLTIEELRLARNSCWLCGCNWQQDHVSLDCPECGGYALSRPCPNCDGKCQQVWKRNINTTHDSHKASWTGQCSILHSGCAPPTSNGAFTTTTTTPIPRATHTPQAASVTQTQDNNQSIINSRRDKTLVFDQHHTNDNNKHCDHARTFPSLGQCALTKNLCPV